MNRGLIVLAVVALAVVACGPGEPEPVPLEIRRTDFLGRDLQIDLREGSEGPETLIDLWSFGEGWGRPDATGRWAYGNSVEVRIVTAGGVRRLRIECKPYHRLLGDQRVAVTLDGDPIGAFRPEGKDFRWYELDFAEPLTEGVVTVGLHFDQTRSPHDAGHGSDKRRLALKVRQVALDRGSEAPDVEGRSPGCVRITNGWRVLRPGRLFLNINSDDSLEKLRVRLHPGDGETLPVLLTLVLPQIGEQLDQQVFDSQAPIESGVELDAGGRVGAFQIIVDVGDGGLEIDRPEAWGWRRTPGAETEAGAAASSGDSPPDIVVILLDAARADHSGSTYGYSRNTTPNISKFADKAVVFSRAFAQAPYTTCSVPTMFTGVSWGAHGVVRGRDRLSDGEETLAESLRSMGYRTIGYSATPNNSERLGMAQGFDQFVQLWEDNDWLASIDPMTAANAVEATLQEGLDERPLFLMVHLVPPHSPYTPPAEFRKWGDPDYDGPCDGTDPYLNSVGKIGQSVPKADLREMIALYDGNLLFSDAAVGKILKDLDRVNRLDSAIIVVTSDHGEAFYEHGRRSHNSTVYDEMLQVPLIISLPQSLQEGSVDASRLVSLEDLTPTILGLVGRPASGRSTGFDLFREDLRDEILLRSSNGQKLTAIRTARWKLIADRDRRLVELYDLKSDPGETVNLILTRPDLVSSLVAQWEHAVAELPPQLGVGDAGMTDQEKAMLRQLGYVD